MPVPNYTDLFNEGYDDLVAKLSTVSGLQVNNDPRNISPPSVFVNIDSIDGYNYNVAKLNFTLQIITLGPGNLDAQKSLLNILAQIYALNIGVVSGRPTNLDIGGSTLPAYELSVSTVVQTA
ncbi:hypothetical protein UFOVP557_15 [uncultured Caudovirales phage]|jgi:hypothetical protein|uniref:Tail completion protein n=1 Tax=uncultured Caudovirales phage TaxID=2100421 RepID=A0A6J5MXH3_9CAUD|nr:hypothetical protein UFOVP557_15 [uncultured Caudovirales phage]